MTFLRGSKTVINAAAAGARTNVARLSRQQSLPPLPPFFRQNLSTQATSTKKPPARPFIVPTDMVMSPCLERLFKEEKTRQEQSRRGEGYQSPIAFNRESLIFLLKQLKSRIAQDTIVMLIDFAGTIIDPGCMGPMDSFAQGLAAALEVDRNTISLNSIREETGLKKEKHARLFMKRYLGTEPTPEQVTRVHQHYLKVQLTENLEKFGTPIDGAQDFFQWLNQQDNIIVIGNTGYDEEEARKVVAILAKYGIKFDMVVPGLPDLRGRPYEDLCMLITKILRVPTWRQIVIDDTIFGPAGAKQPRLLEECGSTVWAFTVAGRGNDLMCESLEEMERWIANPVQLNERVERIRKAHKPVVDVCVNYIWQIPAFMKVLMAQIKSGQLPKVVDSRIIQDIVNRSEGMTAVSERRMVCR